MSINNEKRKSLTSFFLFLSVPKAADIAYLFILPDFKSSTFAKEGDKIVYMIQRSAVRGKY
jgi:hypothetical protein